MSELISKKEILEKYGISYGTLYRWKRMGLIPEEWLVKKSTFTGQETFFSRELICKRVEEILSRKDSESLEQIAKELGAKEKDVPKLIINTNFGEKVFAISDISDMSVSNGKERISIFSGVMGILKNNNITEDE